MANEKKLRCVCCGKILVNMDRVFVVTTVTPDRVKFHSPTCSEECAKMEKRKNIEQFQKIIDEIQKSHIFDTNVGRYPCGL